MSPTGRHHEVLRELLEGHLRGRAPAGVDVIAEPQFNLAADAYTKPDILVKPAQLLAYDVRGPQALLVVEISDTTEPYDLAVKAPLYGTNGVREYWAVSARTRLATVHRGTRDGGYTTVDRVPSNQELVPMLVPAMSVRLADLLRD